MIEHINILKPNTMCASPSSYIYILNKKQLNKRSALARARVVLVSRRKEKIVYNNAKHHVYLINIIFARARRYYSNIYILLTTTHTQNSYITIIFFY